MKHKRGIYIHFPFCRRLCYYCRFTKFPNDSNMRKNYINSLIKEMKLRSSKNYMVDSIYVGGGSPSLLTMSELADIINTLHCYFSIMGEAEFSIELNPEDISSQVLQFYKEIGINRLSLGIQSFSQEDLRLLKRNHSAADSTKAVEMVLKAGFTNINVDFIIGLPGQTKSRLISNYNRIREYQIPHVSAYLLEHVENTDQDEQSQQYHLTRDYLLSKGYHHYEISNYCLSGHFSRHNLKYWQSQNYIGLGVSASSFEKEKDIKNSNDLGEYAATLRKNLLPVATIERIRPDIRRIITGLRLLDGLDESHFGPFREVVDFLKNQYLLIQEKGKIKVNPDEILLLNEILDHFL